MDLKARNVENIISLWTKAGAPFNANVTKAHYAYCYLPFSEWPNRLWSHHFTPAVLDEAVAEMRDGKENLTISYWGGDEELFIAKGLQQKSRLSGMSLPLQEPLRYESRLQLLRVSTGEQCRQWADTFPQAFGYLIHADVIAASLHNIQYYLAGWNNDVIGTAMLYIENGIAGIHSVGVVPGMRRMGFAEEIMKALINLSIGHQASHCVLQASQMGKGIYERLGFKEDFLFTSYKL